MAVGLPVLLKIALVATGGDRRAVRDLQRTGVAAAVRGLDRHPPGGAVGLAAQGLDIAPQLHNGGGDPLPPQQLHQPVPGPALGHRAQVQLHALRQGQYGPLQGYAGVVHPLQQRRQLRLLRHPVRPGGEPPGPDHRVDAHVQGPAGLAAQRQGPLQQGGGVGVEHPAAVPVGGADVAALIGDGQQRLQLQDPLPRQPGGLPGPLAVDGEAHGGVHGQKFLYKGFLLYCPRSTGAQQCDQRQGQGPCPPPHSAQGPRRMNWPWVSSTRPRSAASRPRRYTRATAPAVSIPS